ncbi:hypothetical protein CU633_06930 [Bacillus sp. V3-13]|uniref:DUF6470 family protein n=1 Tax=Bacillus sp. V3-13 TaxID=2053728 RepID=UPI000C77F081|nr:DUF6470 family protein [Bacillus sp. V3-13]PLR78244.1 hypothetical protein CU633_06930 [Bacillus sp. V3-13]
MRLPQIQIESQTGRIGLRTNQPVQMLEQKPTDLSIEQPKADLFIHRQPGRLTIDQTMARENLDLKSMRKRSEENAQAGFQALREYVAKTVQEGDELMRIENGGQPIKDQAKRALVHETVFNTGNIPSQFSVKVEYTSARIEVDWNRNKPVIHAQVNKPVHEYIRGTTDVYMEQYPSLKIDFII